MTDEYRQLTAYESVKGNLTQKQAVAFNMFVLSGMGAKLRKNAHKGGWEQDDIRSLVMRLYEEIGELVKAINDNESWSTILDESADVANFAMMIQDRYRIMQGE